MNNILFQSNANGYSPSFIYIISIISIFLGIYIIISKNPILSVLFLIALFSCISVYLILLGLHFIGLSYLLVYVGAVSILFLFILMLINVRISELLTDNKNSIPLAVLTVLFFNYSIYDILPYGISVFDVVGSYIMSSLIDLVNFVDYNKFGVSDNVTSVILNYISFINIANVKSRSWDTLLAESSHIASIGNLLYSSQFILFILASFILLIAMVGAIVITINKIPTRTRRF